MTSRAAASGAGIPPAQKLAVMAWGAGGVNLVKDPLALDDSELILAQNAEPFTEQGRSGLRKRSGLGRVVPTGTVSPGALGGPLLGQFVVDDPAGQASIIPAENIIFSNGQVSTDGGLTWNTYTPDSGTLTATPNSLYDLAVGYDGFLTPCFPPIWFDGVYVMGGANTGQVIGAQVASLLTPGLTPGQLYVQQIGSFAGTGSANDTVVLGTFNLSTPLPFPKVGQGLIIEVMGSGGTNTTLTLYSPGFTLPDGNIQATGAYQLPRLSSTTPVTGATLIGNWLFVTQGTALLAIDISKQDGTESWQSLTTVSGYKLSQLGQSAFGSNLLFSGAVSTGGTPAAIVFGFSITMPNPGDTSTPPSVSATNTVCSINMSTTSQIIGPATPLASDPYLYFYFVGSAPAFTTMAGTMGSGDSVAGANHNLIYFDGSKFHNGSATASYQLSGIVWAGSNNVNVGPLVNLANRMQVQYYRVTAGNPQFAELRRPSGNVSWNAGSAWGPISASAGGGGAGQLDSFWVIPPVMMF